jgi:hypothetical protein
LGRIARGREMVKNAQKLLETSLVMLDADPKAKDTVFKVLQLLHKQFMGEQKDGGDLMNLMRRAMAQKAMGGPPQGAPGPVGPMPQPPPGPIPAIRAG